MSKVVTLPTDANSPQLLLEKFNTLVASGGDLLMFHFSGGDVSYGCSVHTKLQDLLMARAVLDQLIDRVMGLSKA